MNDPVAILETDILIRRVCALLQTLHGLGFHPEDVSVGMQESIGAVTVKLTYSDRDLYVSAGADYSNNFGDRWGCVCQGVRDGRITAAMLSGVMLDVFTSGPELIHFAQVLIDEGFLVKTENGFTAAPVSSKLMN